MSEPMSQEQAKSKYADLLNDLDVMQQSMAYAVRRPVLHLAEQTIVQLETENAALRAEVAHYREACASVGETDGHGWAETTKELRAKNEVLIVEVATLEAENERLKDEKRNQYDVMWGLIDELGIKQVDAGCPDAQIRDHITDLRAQVTKLTALDVERVDTINKWIEQVTALEQEKAQLQYKLNHLDISHTSLVKQLAAMTQERNDLAKKFVDMETYAKFKEEQLAAMTQERDALARERNSWPVLRIEKETI